MFMCSKGFAITINIMKCKLAIWLGYCILVHLKDFYTQMALQFPIIMLKCTSNPLSKISFLGARIRTSIFIKTHVLLHMMHPPQRLLEGEVVPGHEVYGHKSDTWETSWVSNVLGKSTCYVGTSIPLVIQNGLIHNGNNLLAPKTFNLVLVALRNTWWFTS